jgi:hypothetical protein
MLVPTKFTRLEESTIFKMKCILADRREGESVLDVYIRTKTSFYDASEFMHALDVLFILDMIEVEADSKVVQYA